MRRKISCVGRCRAAVARAIPGKVRSGFPCGIASKALAGRPYQTTGGARGLPGSCSGVIDGSSLGEAKTIVASSGRTTRRPAPSGGEPVVTETMLQPSVQHCGRLGWSLLAGAVWPLAEVMQSGLPKMSSGGVPWPSASAPATVCRTSISAAASATPNPIPLRRNPTKRRDPSFRRGIDTIDGLAVKLDHAATNSLIWRAESARDRAAQGIVRCDDEPARGNRYA